MLCIWFNSYICFNVILGVIPMNYYFLLHSMVMMSTTLTDHVSETQENTSDLIYRGSVLQCFYFVSSNSSFQNIFWAVIATVYLNLLTGLKHHLESRKRKTLRHHLSHCMKQLQCIFCICDLGYFCMSVFMQPVLAVIA